MRAFLTQFLSLDDVRRADRHSLYALLGGALRFDRLNQRLRIGMAQLHQYITSQIITAGHAANPEVAAATFLALTDGLAAHVLGGYLTPQNRHRRARHPARRSLRSATRP